MVLIGLVNLISLLIGVIVGLPIALIIGSLAAASVGLISGLLIGGLIGGICFLFTMPVGIAAMMYAYETIFCESAPPGA